MKVGAELNKYWLNGDIATTVYDYLTVICEGTKATPPNTLSRGGREKGRGSQIASPGLFKARESP